MSAPYSPAFGPSFAPGVAADSDSPSTSITRPSVYDQVLQSSSTSPAERTAQQQHEISSLRARLVEYRGEVEKLSLTSGLVLSLKSELRDGVLEELYSISVDLLDAKLQLQDVLEASVQVDNHTAQYLCAQMWSNPQCSGAFRVQRQWPSQLLHRAARMFATPDIILMREIGESLPARREGTFPPKVCNGATGLLGSSLFKHV